MKHVNPLLIILFIVCSLFAPPAGAQSLDAAGLALLKGNYSKVIELLKPSLDAKRQNAQALYLSGLAYKGLGRYALALKQLNALRALRPGNTELLLILGNVYEKSGNTPRAVTMYQNVLQQDSLNHSARLNLAAVYFAEGHYNKAAVLYNRLLKDEPENAYLLRRTGMCLFKTKQYQPAANLFLKALRTNEQDVVSACYLGKCYLKLEQLPAALQSALNGLRAHPQNRRLLKLQADVLFRQKSFARAASVYRSLVNHAPVSRDIYKKLGLSYYYLRNFPSALLALQKTYEADSTDGPALYYLGLVHKELGNYAQGAALLNRAVTLLIPDYIQDVFAQLAYCQDKEKNYSAAVQSYKRALQFAPDHTIYLFFVATLYDRYYKDKQIALTQYQRFIEQAPEAEKRYKDYALERMKALKEQIHFQKGRKK